MGEGCDWQPTVKSGSYLMRMPDLLASRKLESQTSDQCPRSRAWNRVLVWEGTQEHQLAHLSVGHRPKGDFPGGHWEPWAGVPCTCRREPELGHLASLEVSCHPECVTWEKWKKQKHRLPEGPEGGELALACCRGIQGQAIWSYHTIRRICKPWLHRVSARAPGRGGPAASHSSSGGGGAERVLGVWLPWGSCSKVPQIQGLESRSQFPPLLKAGGLSSELLWGHFPKFSQGLYPDRLFFVFFF